MSGGDPSGTLRDIGALFGHGRLGEQTDRQLLERFVNRSDSLSEDAFTALLQRHGPMVWGVCRRLLPDQCAAADAFQATFLVLVRRASVVRVDDSLGPWLYGVSRRVAARARSISLRQRVRETSGVEVAASVAPDPERAEWLAILDEEIARLPERHRAVIVLCDLEGMPHEEAARQLGCPVGTVGSRLSRGRQRLRDRLVRRGLAPAAAVLWAETVREASAAIPPTLISLSTRLLASSSVAGAVPVAVTVLAEGVLQMMWVARLKPLIAVSAALVLTTAGVVVQGRQQPAAERANEQAKTTPPAQAVSAPGLAANQALAREQLVLIDKALDVLHQLVRTARMRPSDPSFSVWGRRKIEALRNAGAGKAEMVAELEKYINHVKEDVAIAEAARQNAQGTMVDVFDAQYRHMEAEIWLNEEKARR